MDKLRDSANMVVNNIHSFVSEFVREKQVLADEAKRLAEYDEALKVREAVALSSEEMQAALNTQESQKNRLQGLQNENSRDFEANDRERKLLADEKSKWERQRDADQKGIDNERQDIRKQNAALAKEKAEYKEKILKKLKVEV